MTLRAIYENGVFRPTEPVNLPNMTEVDVDVTPVNVGEGGAANQREILAIMQQSYPSGETDVAERHNEHQP